MYNPLLGFTPHSICLHGQTLVVDRKGRIKALPLLSRRYFAEDDMIFEALAKSSDVWYDIYSIAVPMEGPAQDYYEGEDYD